MSAKDAREFLQKIAGDADHANAIVALAAKAGYKFSVEDLAQALKSEELNLGDLDKVTAAAAGLPHPGSIRMFNPQPEPPEPPFSKGRKY